MIIETLHGNLIEFTKNGKFDIIVHGCNCFCAMGKGLAYDIKEEFPKAWEVDKHTSKGDKNKLGTFSYADIILQIKEKNGYRVKDLIVVNLYTQYYWGKKYGKNPVDYNAIKTGFKTLNEIYKNKIIGIPMIGAGLAGGDWNRISKIINDVTPNLNIILVEYENE